jgi:hypothetical protein
MSDPSISSTEKRREMMRKVEQVLAEAEARVQASKDDHDAAFLSDISSQGAEEEEDDEDFEIDASKGVIHFSDVSSIENGSEAVHSELHVSDVSSVDDMVEIKDVEKSQIYSSDSEVSLEILPMTTPEERSRSNSSFSKSSSGIKLSTAARTLLNDLTEEPTSSHNHRPSPFQFHSGGSRRRNLSLGKEHEQVPEDRNIESKDSFSSGHITPDQPYTGEPIISPPFSIASPDKRKTRARFPITEKKASKQKEQIASPPKMKSMSSSGKFVAVPNFSSIKSDIETLRSEFQHLQEETKKRRQKLINLDEKFKESVHMMEEKAMTITNPLERNFTRSNELQRENNMLKEQIKKLRSTSKHHYTSDTESSRSKSPQTLLQELDVRDHHVQRRYPPIPKTPGTMFTTELVEIIPLEVGEHAYLAEVMDRQWNTSDRYMPSLDKYI